MTVSSGHWKQDQHPECSSHHTGSTFHAQHISEKLLRFCDFCYSPNSPNAQQRVSCATTRRDDHTTMAQFPGHSSLQAIVELFDQKQEHLQSLHQWTPFTNFVQGLELCCQACNGMVSHVVQLFSCFNPAPEALFTSSHSCSLCARERQFIQQCWKEQPSDNGCGLFDWNAFQDGIYADPASTEKERGFWCKPPLRMVCAIHTFVGNGIMSILFACLVPSNCICSAPFHSLT